MLPNDANADAQAPKGEDRRAELQWIKGIDTQLTLMNKVFLDAADPIVIRDLEGRVLQANHEVERVFGWARDEFLGEQTTRFLPQEWQELSRQVLERCRNGETVRNVEFVVRHKSGRRIPVLCTAFLLTDEHDQPVAIAEIVKDISKLKCATERCERRNRELKQFANALTHDLAAPLRSIGFFAQELDERTRADRDAVVAENLEMILEAVGRMERMIGDLLEYARLDLQTPEFHPVDMNLACDEAMANLRASIAASGAEVTRGTLPGIVGHHGQLVQLLQNLIDNAIKFRRHEPSRVQISAEESDEGWQFAVRDNGIGIDAGQFEKIFEVFRRAHADGLFPGTGIGLATCRTIVELHGGRIWVESERGRGSVFRFVIPHRAADDAMVA